MAAVACARACVCLLCVGRGEIAHAVRGDVSPIRAQPHRGESPARGTRILRAHGAGQIAGYRVGTTIAISCLGQNLWCLLYATAILSDGDAQGNGQIVAPSPCILCVARQACLAGNRWRQGNRMLEGVHARWGVWLLLSRTLGILSRTFRSVEPCWRQAAQGSNFAKACKPSFSEKNCRANTEQVTSVSPASFLSPTG